MQNQDRAEFAKLLTSVYSAYDKDISEFTLTAFWETLKRFDFEDVRRAFHVHYGNPDSGQFAPKPGNIIKILEGGSGDRGLLAWSKVERAVRQVGPYQSVVFDDPIIHAVIRDMGGWIQLGDCQEREFEFRGKEFATRYRGYAETGRNDNFPAKLIGIAEADNTRNKRRVDPPLLIGNRQQAQLVLEQGASESGLMITKADVSEIANKLITSQGGEA